MKNIGFGVANNIKKMNKQFIEGLSYIVDNHADRWNSKAFGLAVYYPDTLLKENKDNLRIFVLSDATLYYNQISAQLREMGFLDEIHFTHADFWIGNNELPGAYVNTALFESYKENENSEDRTWVPDTIIIMQPKVIQYNGRSRLICEMIESGNHTDLWFEVDNEYAQYLCHERSDAFVIRLLPYAMRNGKDIKCTAPVTEELLFNLEVLLIPTLVKNGNNNFYQTKIYADAISDTLECANGVGTGISCGVDSFHAIMNLTNPKYEGVKLTHLIINNINAFRMYEDAGSEYTQHVTYERSKAVAKKLNIPLIETNSNIKEILNQKIVWGNTYEAMFAVFALKKLWRTYFHASSCDFSRFTLINVDETSTILFDLLIMYCFSRSDIKIYPEGAEKKRIEKVRDIGDFELAQKYLTSCYFGAENCGICAKCRSNLLELDATGHLDKFKDVYDIEYYKSHKLEYLEWLCKSIILWREHLYCKDIYEYFKKNTETAIVLDAIERKLSYPTLLNEREYLTFERNKWQKYANYFFYMLTDEAAQDIYNYLLSNNYRKIAFYGESFITRALCLVLEKTDIEIAYIIGNDIYEKGIPHYSKDVSEYPIVDAIVISSINDTGISNVYNTDMLELNKTIHTMESMKNKVKQRVSFPVLTVYDLIGEDNL